MHRRLSGVNSHKEILIVVASLVHCCAIKKNVVVASQLYDVADIQFTAEKEGLLELLKCIQKYNLGNSVPNIVIMLRIFLIIAVSVVTWERRFSKLKLIKDYLRSNTAMSNRNGIQSQESCHCLDQGRTLNDILMRAAR